MKNGIIILLISVAIAIVLISCGINKPKSGDINLFTSSNSSNTSCVEL